MQPDRFTVKSQEAINDSQRLAAANSNTEVAPAHLLVVLLEQEDGLVPAVLGKLGADLDAIRSRARAAMSDLPRLSGGAAAEPRPSSAFVEVLQRAEGEMASMGDEYVSTEHMLLAIADSKIESVRDPAGPRLAGQGDRRGPGAAQGRQLRTPKIRCRHWRSSAAT